MRNRLFPHILLAAVFLAVLFLTVIPARTSAQDPVPIPTGELTVDPKFLGVGETTAVSVSDVVPPDQQVRVEWSDHLVPEGEGCDTDSATFTESIATTTTSTATSTATTTESAVAPMSVTLRACSAGEAHVRLVASETGHVIAEESVVIATEEDSEQGCVIDGIPCICHDYPDRCPTATPTPTPTRTPTPTPTYTPTPTRTPRSIDPPVRPPFPTLRAPTHTVSADATIVTVRYTLPSRPGSFHYVLALYSSATGKFNDTVLYRSADVTGGSGGHRFTQLVLNPNSWYQVGFLACRNTRLRNCGSPALGSVWQPAAPPALTVGFSAPSYRVNEGANVTVTVRLNRRANRGLTIPISVTRGTAESRDYSVSGLPGDGLAFRSGDLSKSFTVITNQDSDCDNETVNLKLGTLPVGVTAGTTSTSTVRIRDDCGVPTATVPGTVSQPAVTAGDELLNVNWVAPPNGGSAITGYRVQHRRTTASWSGSGASVGGGSTVTDVTGLTNGVTYEVRVRACNSVGCGDWSTLNSGTPTAGTQPPVISGGPLSVSYPENGTGPVGTYTASDADNDRIEWELPNTSHAADRTDFTISDKGVLSFRKSPDYENPHDSNKDNVYKVTVWATDGNGGVDDRNVTVTVTNLDESGSVRLSSVSPRVNSAVSATLSDPDGGVSNPTWQWQRSSNGVTWSRISGAVTRSSYTPSNGDVGKRLRVSVTYDDAHGTRKSAISGATNVVAQPYRPPPVRPTPPARVEGLIGRPGSSAGEIVLDWGPAARAASYEVQQWKRRLPAIPAYQWVTLRDNEVDIDSAMTSAVVRGLATDRPHQFRIRARGPGGRTDSSAIRVDLKPPPQYLRGYYISGQHRKLSLAWDPVPNPDVGNNLDAEYHVEQYFATSSDWKRLTTTPLDGVTIGSIVSQNDDGLRVVVGGLAPGNDYMHRVRAESVQGVSDPSNVATTTVVDERPGRPGTPTVGITVGNRGITVELQGEAPRAMTHMLRANPSTSSITFIDDGSISRIPRDGDWVFVAADDTINVIGLVPGTDYTFSVRGRNAAGFGPAATSTEITAPVPKSLWGRHLADHQVKFTYSASNVTNEIIEKSATSTPDKWIEAMERLGMELQICSDCEDRFTVTIRQVNNNNDSYEFIRGPDGNCGWSFGCVGWLSADGEMSDHVGPHLGDMYIKIEDPPVWIPRDDPDADPAYYKWTFDRDLHREPIRDVNPDDDTAPTRYYWIDRVMLHEYGHTLGLDDYYDDDSMDHLVAMMNISLDITDEDIEQLRAIYIRHEKH